MNKTPLSVSLSLLAILIVSTLVVMACTPIGVSVETPEVGVHVTFTDLGNGLLRIVDYDAGVVCWETFQGHGIDCISFVELPAGAKL